MSTANIIFTLMAALVVCYILADKESIFLALFKDRMQVSLKTDQFGRPYILVFIPVKVFGRVFNITVTKRKPQAK